MGQGREKQVGDERLIAGYTGRLFLGISLGWSGIAMGRHLLPPLLPAIIADLGITPFQAGAVLTVLWAMRSLFQYPGGRLADGLSRKTVLVGSLVVSVGGLLLLSVGFVYELVLLAVIILGSGSGAYSVTVRTATADFFVDKRGRAFGIQTALNSSASMLAAGVAVLILAAATWRSAFIPLAGYLAVVAVALHVWFREPYVIERPGLNFVETVIRVFGDARIRLAIAVFTLFMFAWQGLIGFLPTFLQVEKGFSTTAASAGFALVYVIGIGAGPLAGSFSDRYGNRRAVVATLLFCSVGLTALLLAESFLLTGVAIVIMAVGTRGFIPATFSLLMNALPGETMGGDLGASKTFWGILASSGPAYVGFVAGRWSYTLAYAGLICCFVLSAAIVLLFWEPRS